MYAEKYLKHHFIFFTAKIYEQALRLYQLLDGWIRLQKWLIINFNPQINGAIETPDTSLLSICVPRIYLPIYL